MRRRTLVISLFLAAGHAAGAQRCDAGGWCDPHAGIASRIRQKREAGVSHPFWLARARHGVNDAGVQIASIIINRDHKPRQPFRLAEARAYLALKGECAMTKDINTWRREADRLLGAPVVRVRSISTVAGKVADRFDQVMAARQRGMPWRMIADALGTDGELKEESVESAFRRLCSERSLALPGRRKVEKSKTDETGSTGDRPVDAAGPTSSSLGRLSEEQERWVDDGDD